MFMCSVIFLGAARWSAPIGRSILFELFALILSKENNLANDQRGRLAVFH